jgi:uncharacterized protein
MIRVVIDTNVLVSALLTSGGLPEAVIDLAISGAVQWFASESVLAEYEAVLTRPRLAIDSRKAAGAIARIRAIVSVVTPAVRVAVATDPDDNQFLELRRGRAGPLPRYREYPPLPRGLERDSNCNAS